MALEETNQQEKASAWFFEQALKNNKHWPDENALIKDKKYYNELCRIYPAMKDLSSKAAQEWLPGFIAQQKTMLQEFSQRNWKPFDTFNQSGGFMDYISEAVKKCYKISKKDSWNPADIWCIRDEVKVRKAIESVLGPENRWGKEPPLAPIGQLNNLLVSLYRNGKAKNRQPAVCGISLKQITPTMIPDPANPKKKKKVMIARYEEVNLDKNVFTDKNDPHFEEFNVGYEVTSISINLTFDNSLVKRKQNGKDVMIRTIATQDSRINVTNRFHKPAQVFSFQIKPLSTSDMSNLKYEASMSGAGKARLGKAPVNMVALEFRENKVDFTNDNKGYPKDLTTYKSQKQKFLTMWTDLKGCSGSFASILDKNILGDKVGDFDKVIQHCYTPANKPSPIDSGFRGAGEPQIAMSKLMQLSLIHALYKMVSSQEAKNIGKRKLDNMWTNITFFSQKKNRRLAPKGDKSGRYLFGPFGKLY
jgi:hypothetical protein